jgi:hypothetical protein
MQLIGIPESVHIINKKYESAAEHQCVLLEISLTESDETRVIAEYYRFEFNSQRPYDFEHSFSSWLMSFKRALLRNCRSSFKHSEPLTPSAATPPSQLRTEIIWTLRENNQNFSNYRFEALNSCQLSGSRSDWFERRSSLHNCA